MGNYKFRLSDIIRPNAWFHKRPHTDTTTCTDSKLTKTNTPSSSKSSSLALAVPNQCPNNTTNQQPHLSDPRKSYRFTSLHHNSQLINPLEPPRKSSRRRRSAKKNRPRRTNVAASVSASFSCHNTLKAPDSAPEQYSNSCLDQTSSSELDSMLTPETFDAMLSWSGSSCKCRDVQNDIIPDIDSETHTVPELAPIITKKNHNQKTNIQSPGFKMRTNSPRIANKRIHQGGRKSAMGGFAVVKSSRDPRKDFRESMVEMIVENNIMGSSKDLEQLLACYLSLNSDEYHDIIISVFKQIWFDFIHVPTK